MTKKKKVMVNMLNLGTTAAGWESAVFDWMRQKSDKYQFEIFYTHDIRFFVVSHYELDTNSFFSIHMYSIYLLCLILDSPFALLRFYLFSEKNIQGLHFSLFSLEFGFK